MGWLNGKKSEAPQVPQGVNWEKLLLDIKDGVTECKSEIGHTKGEVEKTTKTLTDHCTEEQKDKIKLKIDICKKIDDMKGPDHALVMEHNVKVLALEKKKTRTKRQN